jgi:hypothetical protein
MKLAKTIFIASVLLGAAGGLRVEGQPAKATTAVPDKTFTQITQQEITLILEDVRESNPMLLKRLEEDPLLKQAQISSLRELLAFASEAQRTGLADAPNNRNELDNIRYEVTSVSYDRHINKGKPPAAPFSGITDTAIADYWAGSATHALPAAVKADRKAKFDQFLATKVYLLGRANPEMKERVPTAEETEQARDVYARIHIYADEYANRAAAMPLALRQKVALQVKLQQAQFLARLYSESMAPRIAASETDIASYLAARPELADTAKRATAEKILARAKTGEDFAKLANEFSEDPGNRNEQGEPQGGLYQNIKKGVFVPPFERAALALSPGQIAPELVESDFGFHIIKLERKTAAPAETYDVRHILIATGVSDPSNPGAAPVPAKEYARRAIESENEQKIIDRIVAANHISVPVDFVVPSVTVPVAAPKAAPKTKPRPARKRT